MTNRLETALEQTANVFIEMARELKSLREEISELQLMVHKHDSCNRELAQVFQKYGT